MKQSEKRSNSRGSGRVARTTWHVCAGLLILLTLPALLAAQQGHHGHHGHQSDHAHHDHVELKAQPVSEHSVYQLDREWISHRGETVRLDRFLNHPVIVVMFYGSCTDVCPILIQDSWRLYREVDPSLQDEVQVLAVTFDNERDTPELLADYADRERLNLPNWHFLTGSDMAVRELAMVLGVEYRKRTDGMYDHTNLVALLDHQGEVAHREVGLGREMKQAAERIESILRQAERP